jgi:glycosyltransferase involved in cell wall biosynthesis
MTPLVISIVICTHNRADLARDAILSVLEQDFPRDEYELLIVDNASTDNTRAMAQEICKTHSNVRYIFESNVGLSHARNRGWMEASGEYVGYLDDDAKASAQWLSAAYTVVKDIHPEAFGGPYYAFYNTPKPRWFKDEYGSHSKSNSARPLEKEELLNGGNMFVRRDVLVRLGGFDPKLGMAGRRIAYAEETYFFISLRREIASCVLYYHPLVSIYHLVRPEKFNLWLHPVRYFAMGRDNHRASSHSTDSPASMRGLIKWCIKIILQIIWALLSGPFLRDRKKYPYFQNYLYEEAFPLFAQLGICADSISRLQEKNDPYYSVFL